jgi:hypothetical protein
MHLFLLILVVGCFTSNGQLNAQATVNQPNVFSSKQQSIVVISDLTAKAETMPPARFVLSLQPKPARHC